MLVKTFASTVLLALIAGAEARNRPVPFYKVARSPASTFFGLNPRADGSNGGYEPETEVCQGKGDTCAEACGDGYEQCVSNHCYNPSAGDTCCAAGSGDACETGHYCAHDANKSTKCCDDKWTIEECSANLNANAPLTEDSPKPTTTSTTVSSTPSSTPPPTTSTSTTSSSAPATTTSTEPEIVSTSSSSSSYVFEQSSSSIVFASSSAPYVPVPSQTGAAPTTDSPTTPAETVLPGSASGNKAALALVFGFFFALF